jgi:hypothetical protein
VLVIFVVLLLVAVVVFYWLQKKKGLYRFFYEDLMNFSSTNFLLGLLLVFFSYERVPFFAARFWFVLWGAGMLWWLIRIGLKLKKIPEKKKEWEKNNELSKYLPKQKN